MGGEFDAGGLDAGFDGGDFGDGGFDGGGFEGGDFGDTAEMGDWGETDLEVGNVADVGELDLPPAGNELPDLAGADYDAGGDVADLGDLSDASTVAVIGDMAAFDAGATDAEPALAPERPVDMAEPLANDASVVDEATDFVGAMPEEAPLEISAEENSAQADDLTISPDLLADMAEPFATNAPVIAEATDLVAEMPEEALPAAELSTAAEVPLPQASSETSTEVLPVSELEPANTDTAEAMPEDMVTEITDALPNENLAVDEAPPVIGPEQAELYHSPETIPETEPGWGQRPAWDEPPVGLDPGISDESVGDAMVQQPSDTSADVLDEEPETEPTPSDTFDERVSEASTIEADLASEPVPEALDESGASLAAEVADDQVENATATDAAEDQAASMPAAPAVSEAITEEAAGDQPADNDETVAEADTPAEADQPAEGESPSVVEVPDDVELQPDELEPNTTYEKNGYTFETDESGRPVFISGELRLEEGERSRLQTEVGNTGLETDDGGHLIGTRFDGPTDAFNLVPQDSNLNRGAWSVMEKAWADALADGGKVEVAIQPVYTDDAGRPAGFDVYYVIDGEATTRSFYNENQETNK